MTPHDQDLVAEQYVPCPSEPVRDQVARYRPPADEKAGRWKDAPSSSSP